MTTDARLQIDLGRSRKSEQGISNRIAGNVELLEVKMKRARSNSPTATLGLTPNDMVARFYKIFSILEAAGVTFPLMTVIEQQFRDP
jgi:hypothetical protein